MRCFVYYFEDSSIQIDFLFGIITDCCWTAAMAELIDCKSKQKDNKVFWKWSISNDVSFIFWKEWAEIQRR